MEACARIDKMVFSRYKKAMTDLRTSEFVLRWARLIAGDGFDRGLQPVQWQALRFLASANRFSRTPKGLTAWLGQTKGSVSQTIIALERKGLIARGGDPDDHRVVRLELTAAGKAALRAPPPDMAQRMLAHLAPHERDTLAQLVERMLLAEIAGSAGTPFGLCRTCRHFAADGTAPGTHRCRLLGVALHADEADQFCIEQDAA